MLRRTVIAASIVLAVALGAGTASGQPPAPVLTTPNPQVNAHFSIPSMGDLDGDGHAEVIVGAGSETVGANTQQGRVYVFSGVTGSLLRTLTTPNPQTDGVFGYRVFANADVDGDAKPDIVVSAPYENVSTNAAQGRVYAFSGVTGTLLRTLTTPNPQANANFGTSIGAADTNADSKADIAVGSPGETVGPNAGQGRAYVFSGANGALLQTLDTPNPEAGAAFGNGLAVGNVDIGTQADIVVGASGETVSGVADQGRTYVFAGGTWTLLRTLVSPNPQSSSGCCSVAVGDIDNDGRADVAMGAMHEDVASVVGQGRVYVFSGATWGLLRTLTTANPETGLVFGFGSFISMGDVTTPGRADIAVSAQFETVSSHGFAGRAYLFSGQTGSVLDTFVSPNPETNGLYGYVPIGRLLDVDGDTPSDVAVGAYNETAGGNAGQGRVYVYRLSPASVGGIAAEPDVTALRSVAASSDRDLTSYILVAAFAVVVAVVGATGWRKRRA